MAHFWTSKPLRQKAMRGIPARRTEQHFPICACEFAAVLCFFVARIWFSIAVSLFSPWRPCVRVGAKFLARDASFSSGHSRALCVGSGLASLAAHASRTRTTGVTREVASASCPEKSCGTCVCVCVCIARTPSQRMPLGDAWVAVTLRANYKSAPSGRSADLLLPVTSKYPAFFLLVSNSNKSPTPNTPAFLFPVGIMSALSKRFGMYHGNPIGYSENSPQKVGLWSRG